MLFEFQSLMADRTPNLAETRVLHVAVGPQVLPRDFRELAEREFRYPLMGPDMDNVCGRNVFAEMERLFDRIAAEIEREATPAREWSIRGWLSLLAALFYRELTVACGISDSRRRRITAILGIYGVLQYVHEHYNRKITLDEVSKLSGYEVSNFCKRFKIATGMSFHKYLNTLRIGSACNLLRDESLPVFSVAETVGFTESKTFCRVFKETTGMTPNEYRRKVYGKSAPADDRNPLPENFRASVF